MDAVKKSPLPPISAAAVIVSVIMYPADIIRAVCMSKPGTKAREAVYQFHKAHGVTGIMKKGLFAEIGRASCSRVIKFWLQPISHELLFNKKEKDGTAVSKGIAGALATIPEVFIISPFENLKLVEQLDTNKRFKSINDAAYHLYKTKGGILGGFYIGYIGMQIRQCLWTGGFFMSLDLLKNNLNFFNNNVTRDTLAGFFAGVFGTCLNCWTDVVRSVIQRETVRDSFNIPTNINNNINKFTHKNNYNIRSNQGNNIILINNNNNNILLYRSSIWRYIDLKYFIYETIKLYGQLGIKGLYSGFGVKCIHMGGSGALLSVLMPRFKYYWGCQY
eukprot:GHVR01171791.1.p1 GENE.GHVR01171791.1~~GHVR01171791.1.p1  ORF type:complete len:332 (-),score=93.08 GHVR01171791.1:89-1084(-)